VLGLRSLYFVLAEVHSSFHYVKYGVGVVLVFVGVKMLIADIYNINTLISLLIIILILLISVILSFTVKSNPSS